ncbi:hypothetical protein GALL_15270 [mine drainage metagenome]|uniref:Uncharacterized protein n=1 Tax=mine drainage metagenome TaxID=410659 RepID=A0A1J5TPM0_9ZZZZ
MTGSNGKDGAIRNEGTERRSNLHLRDLFEYAYRIACPLLESGQTVSNAGSAHFLRVVLHDSFPDLHPQDIAILSVSVECVFRQRSKTANQ